MTDAIVAEGLVKRFGGAVALDGVDLTVAEGTVLGLLGPNGAGKTTTVRVLTTLIRADGGYAEVAGLNVAKHPAAVRRRIGLAGQFAAVDYVLTGRENLVLFGRLYRLGRRQAAKRAERLLERFGLTDVADKAVKTYSGGMARRLDLAAALVATPRVLFMDEPSVGLDPAARLELWDLLEELVRGGMTLLLTTQYLEEAERLADTIAVVDKGKVIARGTIAELKTQVGGDRVDVRIADPSLLSTAADALRALAHGEPVVDAATNLVGVPASEGPSAIAEVVRALDRAGVGLLDISIHQPTLDDVFLKLTGPGYVPALGAVPLAALAPDPVAEPEPEPEPEPIVAPADVAVAPAEVAPAEAAPVPPVEAAPVAPAAVAPVDERPQDIAASVARNVHSWSERHAAPPAAETTQTRAAHAGPPAAEVVAAAETRARHAARSAPAPAAEPGPTLLLPASPPAVTEWIAPAPRAGGRRERDVTEDWFRSGDAPAPAPAETDEGPDPDFVPAHRAVRRAAHPHENPSSGNGSGDQTSTEAGFDENDWFRPAAAAEFPPVTANRARGDYDPDATDPLGVRVPAASEVAPAAPDPAPGPGRRRRRAAESDLETRAAR